MAYGCSLILRVGFAFTVAASCLPSQAAGQPRVGGTLSISIEADPPTLDPVGFASFSDRQAGVILYDTLLEVDSNGKLVPHLAESIESSDDATLFRLKLRSGVTFHDGTAFDSAAVVTHFARIMHPKNRCRCLSDLAQVESVQATGPLEVSFKMRSPAAPFPATLADVAGMIVSPTAVKLHGDAVGTQPVGTGPFMLKDWQRGSRIVFRRNPEYWKGPAYLDEVELRPMPDDQTRIASLNAGNLDIVMNAPARDVIEARRRKQLTVVSPGSLATVFISVNTSATDVADVRVRQALAHALDRKALNQAINRGLYKIANTPFGSGLNPHEQVDGYPDYDPAKSRKLLADYGKPVHLKLTVNASPLSVLSAQALQQMWKKVGVETEINQLEQTTLVRMAAAKNYQLMLLRWAGGLDPDKNVYQFFHSKGSVNRTAYNSAEMDGLLDDARRTTDSQVRLQLYRQVNNLLAKDLPYLFLTYFENFLLANPSVQGLIPVPDGLIRVNAIWKRQS